MSIPEISQEVCETICCEVDKDNTTYSRIAEGQAALQWQWIYAYTEIEELFGEGAAEAALRLAMLTYAVINAQLEVNDLENDNDFEIKKTTSFPQIKIVSLFKRLIFWK